MSDVKILFIGDVVGQPGRAMIQKHVPALRRNLQLDLVIANGENSSMRGRGITNRIVKFFKHVGVDVITTGNHIFAHREIGTTLDEDRAFFLRPANFPAGIPGSGVTTFTCPNGVTVGILNLQGRVFMKELLSCPFRAADSALTFLQTRTKVIVVDFHAETTSEKMALGYYLDGRISGLVGTHTHVPTADERILPLGTGYQTDLGMVGSLNSMLGMQKGAIITNFITQMPTRFEVETEPPYVLWGCLMRIDSTTGKALHIERIQIIDNELSVISKDLQE
jgi:2',3'-cyclic-nucleotide 2'-phosphodiesterase